MIANLSAPTISRLIVFLAAGIILATFIVKDIANERFKKDQDLLDRITTEHFSMSYNLFVQDYLASIKQSTDLSLSILASSDQPPLVKDKQAIRIKVQAAQDHAGLLSEYTKSVSRLIGQLPQKSAMKITADVLVAKSVKILDEVNNLKDEISGPDQDGKSPNTLEIGSLLGRVSVISNQTESILKDANVLTWRFVSDLESQKEKIQQDYEFTVYLSYVLFSLGWVVGLTGQLLQKPSPNAG